MLNPAYQYTRIGSWAPWARFPEPLLEQITELVEKARNPDAENPKLVDVDVLQAIRFAVGSLPFTVAHETITTTTRTASTHTTFYRRYNNDIIIFVTIDAFTDFLGPLSAFKVHLTSYQVELLSSVVAPYQTLGEYSLSTATSDFWINGNLFVHVQWFFGPHREPQLEEHALQELLPSDKIVYAEAIDSALRRGPNLEDLPQGIDFEVEGGSTELVQHGAALVVTVPNREKFGLLMSFTDENDVLVPRGPPDNKGKLLFYPRAQGSVEVKIVGAAKGSLRPFVTKFSVTVRADDSIGAQDEAVPELPPFVQAMLAQYN